MFGASASLSGIFLAFTGVVDTILVALLLTGAVLQSQFLPHTYGPCHNAENWKNGTDGRNFFVVLNETGHFDGFGTYDICKKYTTNWVVTFVVMYASFVSSTKPFRTLLMGKQRLLSDLCFCQHATRV